MLLCILLSSFGFVGQTEMPSDSSDGEDPLTETTDVHGRSVAVKGVRGFQPVSGARKWKRRAAGHNRRRKPVDKKRPADKAARCPVGGLGSRSCRRRVQRQPGFGGRHTPQTSGLHRQVGVLRCCDGRRASKGVCAGEDGQGYQGRVHDRTTGEGVELFEEDGVERIPRRLARSAPPICSASTASGRWDN